MGSDKFNVSLGLTVTKHTTISSGDHWLVIYLVDSFTLVSNNLELVYKWVLTNLMFGVTLQWMNIPNTPSRDSNLTELKPRKLLILLLTIGRFSLYPGELACEWTQCYCNKNLGQAPAVETTRSDTSCIVHYILLVNDPNKLFASIFIAVFAYVGGLVVFLSKVFTIVLHYTFRAFFLFMNWCRIQIRAREGHRASVDLPYIQDHSNVTIQEPFQYVERSNPNESEVTDSNCHMTSIDTCHIEEGDPFVNSVISSDCFH